MLRVLGEPSKNLVVKMSGDPHDKPTAPQYLVYPVIWSDVDTQYLSGQPCLTDLGASFEVTEPPSELGVPGPYRAPELFLGTTATTRTETDNSPSCVAGLGSDLWALGCTLFEIRTGRKLFSPFDDEEDAYLDAMVFVLGVMPEPWWSGTWAGRKRMYKDEADEQGRAVPDAVGDEGRAWEDVAEGTEVHPKSTVHPSVAQGARSLKDMLAPGLWYMSEDGPRGEVHRYIPDEESRVFADLLGRLLKYRPEDRISAKEALKHAWFKI